MGSCWLVCSRGSSTTHELQPCNAPNAPLQDSRPGWYSRTKRNEARGVGAPGPRGPKESKSNEQISHYGRRAPSTRGERMTPRETPANTGGCAGLTKAELIVRAANVRGNPEHVRACVRSMRLLISQTDDEAIT